MRRPPRYHQQPSYGNAWTTSGAFAVTTLVSWLWHDGSLTAAVSALDVTVLGGTGFVGSRVCQQLVARGASVTSVSRSGVVPSWCADEPWTRDVEWRRADLCRAPETPPATTTTPDALVSCVGAIGTDPEELRRGNGLTNANGFGAYAGKVSRTALVSVSSEVSQCYEDGWLPAFFEGYFDGKRRAEEAATEAAGVSTVIVRPTFIYGGDSFGLVPPRVSAAYGSGIEQLLSLGVFRFLADRTPGLIRVALLPPSSVDAVAAACVQGVLGELKGVDTNGDDGVTVLEGADAINKATDFPPATGLTEAFEWIRENAVKTLEFVKEKVEEAQKNS